MEVVTKTVIQTFTANVGVWRSGLVRWCSDQGVTGSNPTAVSMSLCPWARHFTPNCSCGDCPQYWVCKSLWIKASNKWHVMYVFVYCSCYPFCSLGLTNAMMWCDLCLFAQGLCIQSPDSRNQGKRRKPEHRHRFLYHTGESHLPGYTGINELIWISGFFSFLSEF